MQRGGIRDESCLGHVLKRGVLVVLMDEKWDGKLMLLELGALDCCRDSDGERSIQGNIAWKEEAACTLCVALMAEQGVSSIHICDPSMACKDGWRGASPKAWCVYLKYLLLPLLGRRQSLASLA
jgi:hypothetical protein